MVIGTDCIGSCKSNDPHYLLEQNYEIHITIPYSIQYILLSVKLVQTRCSFENDFNYCVLNLSLAFKNVVYSELGFDRCSFICMFYLAHGTLD